MKKQVLADSGALCVEVVRGGVVESEHKISMAMVDVDGRHLLEFGDTSKPIFLRSSAKPFQALPFVEGGHADELGLTARQLSILCASHAGTDEHVALVRELLAIDGFSEDQLRCGVHTPYDRATAMRMLRQGEEWSTLRHNCSGKHAGMLLFSAAIGADLEGYLDRSGTVQQAIMAAFAEMTGIPSGEVVVGIDGCSAPNFAIPLPAAAHAYARLMDPSRLSEPRAAACRRIVRAMVDHPIMVSGEGRFDTELMQVVAGRLLAKGGAEGYQAIGVPQGSLLGHQAAGITLKAHDGDQGKRAVGLATLAVLRTLGLISPSEIGSMSAFDARPLYNFREIEVGEIRLAVESQARLSEAYERI